jgi:hypothetical protein
MAPAAISSLLNETWKVAMERAADAPFLPAGAEHEMFDDQLAAPFEQVGEGFIAVRPVNTYGLSILTHGKARISAVSLSCWRVVIKRAPSHPV